MNRAYALNPEQYRIFSKWHNIIAALLVLLLALLWLLGYGPGAFRDCVQGNVASDESRHALAPVPGPVALEPKNAAPIQGETEAPQVDANLAPTAPPESAQSSEVQVTAETSPGDPTARLTPPATETLQPEREKTQGAALSARVYFPRNEYRLPNDASGRLANVVTHLKENPTARAQIAGFHDRSGRLSYNVELANKRAKAVAQALEKAGITATQVELLQSSQTRGSGKPEEARRVELNVTN